MIKAKIFSLGLLLTMQSASFASPVNTLNGSMSIIDKVAPINGIWMIGSPCVALGGFGDIESGGTVVLRNDQDKIIAVGNLSNGVLGVKSSYWVCVLNFSLANVPESPFYTLSLGNRNPFAISIERLKEINWMLKLVI